MSCVLSSWWKGPKWRIYILGVCSLGSGHCRVATEPVNPWKPKKNRNLILTGKTGKIWKFIHKPGKTMKFSFCLFDYFFRNEIRNFKKFPKTIEKFRKPQGAFENFWKDLNVALLRTSQYFQEVSRTDIRFTELNSFLCFW